MSDIFDLVLGHHELAGEEYEIALSRAVIRHAIKDLGGADPVHFSIAKKYLESERFSLHRENAGYPPELLDSLKDLVLLSKVQRKFVSNQLLRMLRKNFE